MRQIRILVVFAVLIVLPISVPAALFPPGGGPGQPPDAHPEHVRSAETLVAAFYETISGPRGQARDWDRYRGLFFPEARLISAWAAHGTAFVNVLSVEEYIEAEKRYFEGAGYFKRPIAMQVQRYGRIAHVISPYESRRNVEDEQPYARGVNMLQLAESGGRWWIVSATWQRETEEFPIPEEFLAP